MEEDKEITQSNPNLSISLISLMMLSYGLVIKPISESNLSLT